MFPTTTDRILSRAREVATALLAPEAATIDAEARWPEAGLRALQRAGLGGLVIPEQAGGLGQGLVGLAQVSEILGRACGSTSLCFGMHCVAAAVLAAKATPDQAQRFLDPIIAGEHLTTLALSEPGSGAHFYVPKTGLAPAPDGSFVVTGGKAFVTNGGHADSYVLSTATVEPNLPLGQFSCVVVPAGAPGLVWGDPWKGVGMRGNSSRGVELRGVPVPRADLLGEEGDQIWYLFNVVVPFFLIAMAGTYLGIADAALEEARTRIAGRRYAHSGTTAAQQPVLQHRIGVCYGAVERTRQLVYHAAARGDASAGDALPALCSAKAEAADCVVAVTNEAMTLAGGIGYAEDGSFARHLRDARSAHVMSPTTDMLRTWTGRALLGLPLLGD